MSLYFWIISITFLGPFFLSFDKKVAFHKDFKAVFISIILVAIPFLIWDVYFTQNKVWGFNLTYLSGIYIYNLPLEECLFFITIPFACIFIYQVLKIYFPQYKAQKLTHFFAFIFTGSGIFFGIIYIQNSYTSLACIVSSVLTIWIYFINKSVWYQNFVFTFLVSFIPFLIVNGVLTGSITENPIVYYNEKHIIGYRLYTIPIEDLYYNYSMLLPIIGIFEYLKKKSKS